MRKLLFAGIVLAAPLLGWQSAQATPTAPMTAGTNPVVAPNAGVQKVVWSGSAAVGCGTRIGITATGTPIGATGIHGPAGVTGIIGFPAIGLGATGCLATTRDLTRRRSDCNATLAKP